MRLRFSLLPRSHGECGWAKYTGSPVAVMVAWRAISVPQSQVSDRRIAAGRPSTAAMTASPTVRASRPVNQGHQDEEPGHAFDQGRGCGLAVLADDVGSGWGAVSGLLPVRFPGPPSAPDERVSAHPALHGFPGQVAAEAATVLVHGVGMLLDRQR